MTDNSQDPQDKGLTVGRAYPASGTGDTPTVPVQTPVKVKDFREALASLAHEQWSGWMEYLFKMGRFNDDGTFTIDAESVKRWQRQMKASYLELPENEKNSDRVEADKVIELLARNGIR